MKMIALLSALAGSASAVFAQGTLPAYPLESEIRLEVWNGASWGNTVNASPGQQVEYRVVINYTGPRTDLLGLGDSRYQPTFSNADNVGVSKDTLAAFPGDGTSVGAFHVGATSYPAVNMVDPALGQQGGPLNAYGRITYGGFGQTFVNRNRLRNFRHGGDSAQSGAATGSWLRVSGEFVTQWPSASILSAGSATDISINNIARGISASQLAPQPAGATGSNLQFVPGVTDLVVFRHAIVLSDDTAARVMEVSVAAGSLTRAGNVGSVDDRRYITWHENVVGLTGTYRTSVAIVPATIVIPTPGVLAMLSLTGVFASRRRR